jgi:hypothetical protein
MSIENKIEYKILDTGCILEFLEVFLSATEKT